MKSIIVLGDGMADYPLDELSNQTPLDVALKPNIDFLAQNGIIGMVKTIPDSMSPGSDVANLSVLGYDPLIYYTGRSPLEAVSMGISLNDSELAIRCNFVTLSEDSDYENKIILDHSADEITTEEADILIKEIEKQLGTEQLSFYTGISYRHCLVAENIYSKLVLTPPHDILDKKISDYLPSGVNSSILYELMKKSYIILKDHPINLKRKKSGLKPANSIWLWGDGKKPSLPLFQDKFGLNGAVISAVDLIKGIGICSGLNVAEVSGVTGNIHTNFEGKANKALELLKDGTDFIFIHIEAPDECGHRHEIDNKIHAIELIDKKVISLLIKGLENIYDYRIMILPDHATPLSLRTHTNDPVPFLIYNSKNKVTSGVEKYTEDSCKKSNILVETGHELINKFFSDEFFTN
jgi:2,3-bisphosphoglycerate-independent phosphoglycerate mutase